ncbi:MAG: hydroxymethylglutaryl-CoA lyase [Alphaproteobacteria bacterium]
MDKINRNTIQLVDVSARDGLQNEPGATALPAEVKAEFLRRLAQSGLTRIEAGSFVHPKAVPAMANTAEVAELIRPVEKDFPDVVFSYLVPNIKGLERAKAVGAREVAIFLALSEQFSKANINQGVEESFINIVPVIKEANAAGIHVRGYISNLFGYDDLPFSPDAVAKRSRQLLEAGCFEVSLGDTTGIGKPEQVDAVIAALNEQHVPLHHIAMHFHDTFGSAIANVQRSYELGIRIFDAATGGLGGCPYANSPKGNLAMEDLVGWCQQQQAPCAVNELDSLRRAAAYIHEKLGKNAA